MKRVILLFVSLAVMAFQLLFAQSFTVKGKVIAEEGNEPLIGVAIMQEGTNNGVITDIAVIIPLRSKALRRLLWCTRTLVCSSNST